MIINILLNLSEVLLYLMLIFLLFILSIDIYKLIYFVYVGIILVLKYIKKEIIKILIL